MNVTLDSADGPQAAALLNLGIQASCPRTHRVLSSQRSQADCSHVKNSGMRGRTSRANSMQSPLQAASGDIDSGREDSGGAPRPQRPRAVTLQVPLFPSCVPVRLAHLLSALSFSTAGPGSPLNVGASSATPNILSSLPTACHRICCGNAETCSCFGACSRPLDVKTGIGPLLHALFPTHVGSFYSSQDEDLNGALEALSMQSVAEPSGAQGEKVKTLKPEPSY